MQLAPDMARFGQPGRLADPVGILERQRNAVLAAYVGQSFRHVRTLVPRRLGDAPPEALGFRTQKRFETFARLDSSARL